MTTLTTTDVNAGYLILGFLICLAGVGIIAAVRSARADRWAESQAVRAETIITAPVHLSSQLTPTQRDALDEHWQSAIRDACSKVRDGAAQLDASTSRLTVVPPQRDRRGGGF